MAIGDAGNYVKPYKYQSCKNVKVCEFAERSKQSGAMVKLHGKSLWGSIIVYAIEYANTKSID